jgi:TetR/AcrR family transcriptional regulator, mexJK operon transcriptional repressor
LTSSAAQPRSETAQPRRRAARLASAPVIFEAASTLFLRNGYLGTSVDDIAALARVSKQTVYTHFADKEQLFAELVRGNISRVDAFIESVTAGLGETHALEDGLRAFARRHVHTVVQPEAVQLRRLMIGEAGRFPDLAREYYTRVPQRVVAALAVQLQRLTERGLLRASDPLLAANHLAWLILGLPLDAAMFGVDVGQSSPTDLDRLADAAVDVFLAAYGVGPTTPGNTPTG